MVDHILVHTIPAAYSLLPAHMRSTESTAMLLAIGLQETRFLARRQQGNGPARSFWQFEPGNKGGFAGVFRHPRTQNSATFVVTSLRYSATDIEAARRASEHNDVLACAMARLLLWTSPSRLPAREEVAYGWQQYLNIWRPGVPHPETWQGLFHEAWDRVTLTGPFST